MMGGTSSKKERKDYAFQRQFHEKPSIIPGCPGGGTSKHKATFALQKLPSLGKAWGTGQERHACDLRHLQACMPAEGITPLAEGMAHHPVDPGAVHLLHKGTTTACNMYTDLMSCLQFACKHQLCAHVNCQCVCQTGVTGMQNKHYAVYTTSSIPSPAVSSCATA